MWRVEVGFDTAPDMEAMDRYTSDLEQYDASVSRAITGGVDISVYIEADSIVDAIHTAVTTTVTIVGAEPTTVEAMDEEEFQQRVDLDTAAGFPSPLATLRTGSIRDARAIRASAKK